ncbi:collagen-like protein [Streptomyces sp. NBC_00669]|uniref:collagen-like triple helix repeat-containing protein n=1 Tax=Streptomyces sp. NBC_00669 TaxID=2976011 RepID=UPI002E31090C|nr:collagen-like protein [Streptomyces sp. NBC_00669]
MSTPPEQPSPNPYQQPNTPGQGPGPGPIPPQPPVGGYGTPVPAQHNPYAQPGAYGQPAPGQPGAAQQPPTQGYYMQPGAPGAPGMPGAPRTSGGAGRAVLWAVVGAAVASALWGGGVLLLGKDSSAKADLRGYAVKDNLCDTEDVSAFTTQYPQKDDDPTSYTTKTATVDEMYCDQSLKKETSSLSDAYLYVDVTLHHKTDPKAEFADTWRSYTQRHQQYKISTVAGIGQEAYLLTEDESSSQYVTLAVRDGWMTYTMSWSSYSVGTSSDDSTTVDEAATMVKTATRATLPKLK